VAAGLQDAEHGDPSPVSIAPAPVAVPDGHHYTCKEIGNCATAYAAESEASNLKISQVGWGWREGGDRYHF